MSALPPTPCPKFPEFLQHWNHRPGYLGTWELEGHLLSQAGLTEEPGCPLAGAGSEGHCLEH